MCFSPTFVQNVQDAIEDEAYENREHTVTAKELARRTGRHIKTILGQYHEQGRMVGRNLTFTEAFASKICAEFQPDLSTFTVTRQEAARRLGCHPDTVSRLMRGKGRLVGRTRRYRECDVVLEESQRSAHKLLNAEDVMKLLGCKTEFQLWYLTKSAGFRPRSENLAFPYAVWRPDLKHGDEMPRPDRWTSTGPQWRVMTIFAWGFLFKDAPWKFLTENSYDYYQDLGHASTPPSWLKKQYFAMWPKLVGTSTKEINMAHVDRVPADGVRALFMA
jgi:hypothetical protein